MSEQYNKVTENQMFKSQLQEPVNVESNKSTTGKSITGGFDIMYLICEAILNCIDFLIDKWYVWIVLILLIAVRYFL